MNLRHTRALVAVVLALPLGACSSFLGIHFARNAPKTERVETAAVVAPATEAGRAQLAAGQPGIAIESFQRALASGEAVAPAVNGLGVAYAQLGRDDLAQRYFQEAMAADPGQSRYADNLARLMRSPSYAMRSAAAVAAQMQEAGTGTADTKAPAQAANQPAAIGQLQRVSRAEVRITTAAPQAAPLRSAQALDGRFKPLVRISLAPEAPTGFKPLVRVELPKAKVDGEVKEAVR